MTEPALLNDETVLALIEMMLPYVIGNHEAAGHRYGKDSMSYQMIDQHLAKLTSVRDQLRERVRGR